jgi:cbb3-type cytochrome oxidase cytochrome c subunit
MPQFNLRDSGWRGISLIGITYVYFLIFAQFAFLKRLDELGIIDTHLKIVMAAMAVGGVVVSLLAPRSTFISSPRGRLQIALAICALGALLTLLRLSVSESVIVSFLIGSGLGLLTVTLVTHLPSWLGRDNFLIKIALGTGLGYFLCNLPKLFTATPQNQALTAATLCLAGIVVASKFHVRAVTASSLFANSSISFRRVLVSFTALIWLDSAAFFIIQNNPSLKSGTWEGTLHLWTNGLLHLTAAIVSALLVRRRGIGFVLSAAVLAIGAACLLLLNPGSVYLASVLYPIGVSLYSVALIAYPSLLAEASSSEERGRKAGWIYAAAGWFGSAMGIGMAQNLGHVPIPFVLFASVLVLSPQLLRLLRVRSRELAATVAVLLAAFSVHRLILTSHPVITVLSQEERGRKVYISEGCINCHSQYVRPNTPDVLMWGPVQTIAELREERPPLIGNRRQGPDLSEVGSRRSALWLKAHFYDPKEVSHASFMPSYSHLFGGKSTAGNDLVSYLAGLRSRELAQHIESEQEWRPSRPNVSSGYVEDGAHLFALYCATCHNANGLTRVKWHEDFKRLPPNLETGPFLHLSTSKSEEERALTLARIIKFGLPGTDMPGHEYLQDQDVTSLASWLNAMIEQPVSLTRTSTMNGENQ